jgi:hypothetical protein
MPQMLACAEYSAIADNSSLPLLSKWSYVNSLRMVPLLQLFLSSTVITAQMT